MAQPRGSHVLHTLGLYRENAKKSSCLKQQGLRLDIWYEASRSKPLPRLFEL